MGGSGMKHGLVMVDNQDEKTLICRRILESLPDWFGVPQSIDEYCRTVRSHTFWAYYSDEQPVAFLSLLEHNAYTSEIEVMGVVSSNHRQGIGTSLIKAAERYSAEHGNTFLLVKTLDFSSGDESYARTRAFYIAMEFLPLHVLKDYWDEDNPCLLMCKYIEKIEKARLERSRAESAAERGM
jgi:GNAT superfamily N-acetyltransferase